MTTYEQVQQAAADDRAMTTLAQEHNLFIIRTASAACHRYITKHDDEYAIALRAFCDAVKSYKGQVVFESYAKLVIKNRLIDYMRVNAKHSGTVSLDEEMESGRDVADDEDREREVVSSDAQDQIARLSSVLAAYEINFYDLPAVSPKHEKTRAECARVIRRLILEPYLLAEMRKTKCLPIKKLHESCDVPRKTLERHRKYIVTAAEVCTGDYPVIAEYLKNILN